MQDRRCDEEISRGNSLEAASRWLNSSSSKLTANVTASEAPVSLVILRFLVLGRIGRFADTKGSPLFLEGRIGCKVGTDTDIELRKGSKVGGFSDGKWSLLFLGMIVDIELRKELGVEGFRDALGF
jgi:hypothetical protein